MYLTVDSGRFGSEMVKLPEQKSHVERKSKNSLDFDFKYECIRRYVGKAFQMFKIDSMSPRPSMQAKTEASQY